MNGNNFRCLFKLLDLCCSTCTRGERKYWASKQWKPIWMRKRFMFKNIFPSCSNTSTVGAELFFFLLPLLPRSEYWPCLYRIEAELTIDWLNRLTPKDEVSRWYQIHMRSPVTFIYWSGETSTLVFFSSCRKVSMSSYKQRLVITNSNLPDIDQDHCCLSSVI